MAVANHNFSNFAFAPIVDVVVSRFELHIRLCKNKNYLNETTFIDLKFRFE